MQVRYTESEIIALLALATELGIKGDVRYFTSMLRELRAEQAEQATQPS